MKEVGAVAYKNDLKEHLLVDLHELLIPLIDVGSLLARVGVIITCGRRVGLVMLAPLDDLLENSLIDVGDGDRFVGNLISDIFDHILDEERALSDFAFYNREVSSYQAKVRPCKRSSIPT